MKIELYLVPEDNEGILLKKFLERQKLPFKEIVTNDINLLRKITQAPWLETLKSSLKITYSHSIHIIRGFKGLALKQLLEHIEKYKPKIK